MPNTAYQRQPGRPSAGPQHEGTAPGGLDALPASEMNTNAIEAEQQLICHKYGASYQEVNWNLMVAVADNLSNTSIQPINGLRHLQEGNTNGWYLWRGDDFPVGQADYFKPVCVIHLLDLCPQIVKYLALPAGSRIQTDDFGYEDVWEDSSLINK